MRTQIPIWVQIPIPITQDHLSIRLRRVDAVMADVIARVAHAPVQRSVVDVTKEVNVASGAMTSLDPGVIGSRRPGSQRVPDYMTMTTVRDGLTASVTNRPSPVGAGSGVGTTSFYSDPPNYLSPGDAPSRSSSSSSLSSRMSGRSPISANASGIFHAHGASNMGPGSRSPQPRPTPSTGTSAGGGVYAQPQPTRPLGSSPGQYALSAYAGLSSMQFLSQ
ncbi:hypothetical protein JVT61DRAFT_7338 [Boletus reticuloceps]|uniref:Uncharacterized protein n=1 Tax=Boletus reticuloceps TaxID=495285 RepID=A0A8I2YKG5_9AGAM|nr:hypothetical protein JVT61DRAFT_7338 [Boletus reticuloceps]